jgi:hypothetical protein
MEAYWKSASAVERLPTSSPRVAALSQAVTTKLSAMLTATLSVVVLPGAVRQMVSSQPW